MCTSWTLNLPLGEIKGRLLPPPLVGRSSDIWIIQKKPCPYILGTENQICFKIDSFINQAKDVMRLPIPSCESSLRIDVQTFL